MLATSTWDAVTLMVRVCCFFSLDGPILQGITQWLPATPAETTALRARLPCVSTEATICSAMVLASSLSYTWLVKSLDRLLEPHEGALAHGERAHCMYSSD